MRGVGVEGVLAAVLVCWRVVCLSAHHWTNRYCSEQYSLQGAWLSEHWECFFGLVSMDMSTHRQSGSHVMGKSAFKINRLNINKHLSLDDFVF